MNQRDREKINVSCEQMAPQIDMTDLWPKLLQNRVFNHDDCNIPIWKVSFTFNLFSYKENGLDVFFRSNNSYYIVSFSIENSNKYFLLLYRKI